MLVGRKKESVVVNVEVDIFTSGMIGVVKEVEVEWELGVMRFAGGRPLARLLLCSKPTDHIVTNTMGCGFSRSQ
jgi:hypothetical protein